MGNKSAADVVREMIEQRHPALAVAEACVQCYIAMKQTAGELGDEVMRNLGHGRNAFVGMVKFVASVCTEEEARYAVCAVLTRKGVPNPLRNELKHAAMAMEMSKNAGIAAGCEPLPGEDAHDGLRRMLALLKRMDIRVEDYANRIGVSQNTIYQWTSSNRSPSAKRINRLYSAAAELINEATRC